MIYLLLSFLIADLICRITAMNSGEEASTLGIVTRTLETISGLPHFGMYKRNRSLFHPFST